MRKMNKNDQTFQQIWNAIDWLFHSFVNFSLVPNWNYINWDTSFQKGPQNRTWFLRFFLAFEPIFFQPKWFLLSIQQQRDIMQMMRASQRPVYFDCSGIFNCSLETFMRFFFKNGVWKEKFVVFNDFLSDRQFICFIFLATKRILKEETLWSSHWTYFNQKFLSLPCSICLDFNMTVINSINSCFLWLFLR